MTWRERIQAARERGKFTPEDHTAWSQLDQCPAGEVVGAFGCVFEENRTVHPDWWGPYREVWTIGDRVGDAITTNDFDLAESLVEEIEDRALTIKRAATL